MDLVTETEPALARCCHDFSLCAVCWHSKQSEPQKGSCACTQFELSIWCLSEGFYGIWPLMMSLGLCLTNTHGDWLQCQKARQQAKGWKHLQAATSFPRNPENNAVFFREFSWQKISCALFPHHNQILRLGLSMTLLCHHAAMIKPSGIVDEVEQRQLWRSQSWFLETH